MTRVIAHHGAIYGEPRVSRKRRRCDGHLTEKHWIEPGQMVMPSALPPGDNDIGNHAWWHHWYCADCWPERSREVSRG